MTQNREPAWHEDLHARLEAAGYSDESIIDFIENEVPDEGDILDFKQDLYISASSAYHDKKRQAELMKHFSAFANVRTPARYRYLFIGFNNDGKFIGMQYWDQRDGTQVLDVDDADLRNVFVDKVSPSPDFEVFELERNGKRGGVIVIRQGEQVPLVIESTLRKSGESAFVSEGQAYTRDGSRTTRMDSDDFAEMIRYREELITAKIQELTEGLSQVIGIPDDQLANIDLNVTQSDEGVPVRDLVTTEAPETVDEELKASVKGSKGAGGYECRREGLYKFFTQRDGIDLNENGDEKIKFLVRASIRNHLHGAYWLTQYNSDIDDLFSTVISEDIDGRTISSVERVLLVLDKRLYLDEIKSRYGDRYSRSKADTYSEICGSSIYRRVSEYCGNEVEIRDITYSIEKLIDKNDREDPEELMEQIVEDLLIDDNSVDRGRLRKMELVYLAANL